MSNNSKTTEAKEKENQAWSFDLCFTQYKMKFSRESEPQFPINNQAISWVKYPH
jgi:hypothetical protein